jgi:hypothetical protein
MEKDAKKCCTKGINGLAIAPRKID